LAQANYVIGRVFAVANQPHLFKNRDITRCLKAATAAGVERPTVRIKLPNGTEYTVGSSDGKSDVAAVARKPIDAAVAKPAAAAAAAKPAAAIVRKPAVAAVKPAAAAVVRRKPAAAVVVRGRR
jgi:hypothetical protein